MGVAVNGAPASFRGLGDLPGGAFRSTAAAVSADGRVVVGSSAYQEAAVELRIDFDLAAPPQLYQAFRWTETEGMVGLDLLPGITGSRATAVSADGSVVIGNTSFAGGDGLETNVTCPFRWTVEGGTIPIGPERDYAYDVSADGAVVVGTRRYPLSLEVYVQNPPGPWAVRWTPDDPDDPAVLGRNGTGARAISADGSVIVGSISHPFMFKSDAFRWTAAGDMTYLDHLPGGVQVWATDVSADGSVVVGYDSDRLLSASGWAEAFRWTEDGGIVGLGDLPGGAFWSEALAVSADGSVVVGRASTGYADPSEGPLQTPDPMPLWEAFIWTEAAGMQNLAEFLTTICGLDLTGWTLTTATDLSADGLTVVGSGINPDGNAEAWIATIPEPASLASLALGVAGALCARRRRQAERRRASARPVARSA
ncbi:MAG: hypothetical protein AMS14_08970 [Planctomycetes bacterium DG_20]|nr:MAG: hypothetical protein AMS14_08970 [Planctomycetes bacterium DG_20]